MVLYVVTVLLVLIAIFVSIIRWYPNLSDIIEAKIETRLADILQADVVIESLDISRNKLFSEIIAENVVITDRKNSDNAWQLRKAKLAINLSKSLFSQTLRIKEVSLEGLDLSLQRDATGDLHINQTFLLPSSAMTQTGTNGEANQYTDVRLALIDANIHWVDDLTQTDYAFNAMDISIDPISRGYNFFISGDLPEVLGKSLRAYVKFEGDVDELAEAKVKFYVKTEQFHLSEVAKRLVGESGAKVPVAIDSEIWGAYSNNTLSTLRGFINAEKIVEDAKQINQTMCLSDEYIQQLSMNFEWRNNDRNWEFFANELDVVTSKKDWPTSDLQFKLLRHSLNAKSIFAHVGSMNLGAICNTLHAYSPHIVRFEDQLSEYRINANIDDLFVRFDLSDNHQTSYQYSTQFTDASMWMAQGDRSIKGVSGAVSGGDAGGLVSLDSPRVSITQPDQFPGFELNFATQGDIAWVHKDTSHIVNTDTLRIYNDDLNIDARIYVNAEGGDIYTDSQIYIDHADASTIGNYFPLFKKTRTTKQWLTDAIQKGDVTSATTLFRGNVRDFPFHKASGTFQTLVNVENGILEYKRDWPKLNQVQAKVAINNDHVNITSQHATMMNSKVKHVDINIESFLRSVLDLNGTVDGPAQDLLQYLGESNLVKKTDSVVDQIALQGDSRLEINFRRSLSPKIDLPASASGKIHFLGNTLNVHEVGIELNDVAGEVSFDTEGASSESVLASIYGQPVTLSLTPKGAGASSLLFEGKFDLGEYLSINFPQFKPFFAGITPVTGDLHLPSFFKKNNPDKLKLLINSDLQGIESSLPAPLAKDKNTLVDAIMEFDQTSNRMHWLIKDLIGLHFSLQPQQPFALRLVDLDAADKVAMPEQGLTVSGAWRDVAPDLWLAAYKQYSSLASNTNNSPDANEKPIIDVQFESLLLPQWPAKDVHISAQQQAQNYVIDMRTSLGEGTIQIPQESSQALTIDMTSLVLNKSDQEKSAASESNTKKVNAVDPRSLRAFKFNSDKLSLNDISFSNVVVNASVNEQGMTFDEIKVSAQDMQSSATGQWSLQDDTHQSRFELQFSSIDLEDTLRDLGFNSSLKKGEANASGNLLWNAAPYQFELAELQGQASFELTKGSVSEINPGNAGRLLALLNLGAISRRLSLDFKDVTNKGFTFDSIKGDLTLTHGGELSTEKIAIKASAADIDISGSTNVVNQTYDQKVYVTPAVSGTLPAAGAIVGGPIGAGIGIVVDQVAKGVGLNKVSKIEYKMTGTWQEPVIEKVARKKSTAAPDPQGQLTPK